MLDKKASLNQSMVVIGILFFVFGFVTWLNGPLITYVKYAFDLDTDSKAFWVTFSFYISYFFLALPASWILEKTGLKKGMAIGLLVMAAGTFIFGEFSNLRLYTPSLFGLFIIGSGLSLLQTASNPYISILGPIESAAKRISFMGICNKIAGILAPLVFSFFVFKGLNDLPGLISSATGEEKEVLLNDFASRILWPYRIMGLILLVLSFWILKSPLPELDVAATNSATNNSSEMVEKRTSVFQFPYLLLGVLCLFFYVGAEVMAGDAIGIYAQSFGISPTKTALYTSLTLAFMLLGYTIGIIGIPKYFSQETGLKVSAVLGILFALGAYFTVGFVSVLFIALLGLANALMWPAIWPMAIAGLGKFTEKGSALLIMGISGGAVVPKIFATLKNENNFQLVFSGLMVLSYVYILFYALNGHKIGKKH